MFACEICERQFYYKNSVNRHFRREHINKESRRRLKCTECNHECRFYQDLRTHMYVDHGIMCKVERRIFSDFEEFKNWKRKFEETTHYMYVKHSSSKISATTQERKTYFVCHRTGNFQSGSCGKRRLKRQGSNKINASCPSTMEVVESLSDGSVKLVLWKTHAGHNAEVSRTFLSATERNWLAARISEGASYQKIMKEIHNLGAKGGRMGFIKSQDIRNMRKNLINSRNRVILSDIRSWIKDVLMLNCDEYPVMCFKDRNSPDSRKVLSNKDVMLIVMTAFQETAFKNFRSGIICLDATHCQENYEYQLITLYVTNGCDWCPIIYCVTSVVDAISINYFLCRVKERLGPIRCATLICDDSPPFYESWCTVMSPPDHHFVPLWYIEKQWKDNIAKIKCTETVRSMIFRTMKLMLAEPNEIAFEKRLSIFTDSLKTDARLGDFLTYFVSEFHYRPVLWAGCYRYMAGLELDCENALEKLHDQLYQEYHSGLNSQNLKYCLNSLISISRNCEAVAKQVEYACVYENASRRRGIQNSHKRGVCIKRTEVVETSPTLYKVTNSSAERGEKNESNQIRYLGSKRCKCVLRCDICKVCVHEYSCTCVDYAANFNICEHIHACAIVRNKINVDLSAETDAPLDSFVEEVICEEEIVCNVENLYDDSSGEDISYLTDDESDQYDNSFAMNETTSDTDSVDTGGSVKLELHQFENEQELDLESAPELYYEPFTFVTTDAMEDYNEAELRLTDDGLQIVSFPESDEYEAVLVNDDDSSSFGDTASVYEDAIPPKTAIIALGFAGEGSDGYIFRRFDENTIIRHKVDTLFTLADFDSLEDNDISKQLSSQMDGMGSQDFQDCYSGYDPTDEDSIVLSL